MLVLYLIHLPIRMKIKLELDFEAGEGELLFRILFFPVVRVKGLVERLTLLNTDLIIQIRNKRTKVHLDIEDISVEKIVQFLRRIDLNFLGNLDVTYVFMQISYGSGNAYSTAVRLGTVKILFYSLLAALKSNQHVTVEEEFTPVYDGRTIKCDFNGIFSLSFADIIYGFVLGKVKKANRRAKRHQNQSHPLAKNGLKHSI